MVWLLWIGSLVLSAVLVMLLWSRWAQSRPLQKCAVLSLLVHALLACLAMTIRVVVGEGGGGGGAPIRVRLVHESPVDFSPALLPDAAAAEPASAPALFEPLEAESAPAASPTEVEEPVEKQEATEESAALPQTESSPIEPEAVRAAANETAALEEPPSSNAVDTSDVIDTVLDNDKTLPASPREPTTGDQATENRATETIDTNVALGNSIAPATVGESPQRPTTASVPAASESGGPTTPAAAPYSLRGAPGRLGLVQLQGGSAETEAAVAAALAWLARAQSADGRWDANRFGAGQEQRVLGHDRGGAGRNADTGISALALLALLGAGHSHQQGEFQPVVRRGLEFLIRSQAADGNLFGQSTFYAQMYCHSMATFALAEAQAMSGDARLEPAIDKAIEFSLRAQHAATGGWRYKPGDTGDTSQLGWQIMALASAERAGSQVAAQAWTRVGRFLKSVRRGPRGGLASYRPDGPATTSMTAEALYCRLLLQEMGYETVDEQSADEATKQLLAALPDAGRINLYYWYYATLALHHRQQANDQARAAWQKWNDALTATLINTQVADGPDAGSWNTTTEWGGYGGRVYTTAVAAMCLEVYYRYAPLQSGRWTATRPAAGTPQR
jgi:hypothetical protein